MTDLPNFHEDQVIRDLIRTKAKRLVRRSDFRGLDAEDVEQELHMQLVRRRHKFNPQRGSVRAFTTTVVESCSASLVRRQSAAKRNPARETSLHKEVSSNGAPTELGNTLPEGGPGRSEAEAAELRQDVESVLSRVSEELRTLADQLKTRPVSAVARDRNVPRSTLRGDVSRLRRRFEKSDLDKYL